MISGEPLQFSDVVNTVMTVGDGEGGGSPDGERDDSKNCGKQSEKKSRQNKSYVTAKTLNDREERRLNIRLNHYQKELKNATYQIDVAQRAIRRELQSINPDLQVDPTKGFLIPKGMTREQAELLKSKRRECHTVHTRSISLDEFTEMRRRRSEMGRQALFALQQTKSNDEDKPMKGKDRWKALASVLESNPASFAKMAKVNASNMAAKQNPAETTNEVMSKQVINDASKESHPSAGIDFA